jgi:Outer membrane receptor for ferrienterochelin and colicins
MRSFKLALLCGAALVTLPAAAHAQSQGQTQAARPQPAPQPAGQSQTQTQTQAQTQSQAQAATDTPATATADPTANASEQATTVAEVTVVGQASSVRTSIDSVSYSLANDLQAAAGTLAEALRNVPSVDVDADGNVSLRGDSNVTILVDGRPASQFNGPSRGPVVLAVPASQYARIEVMTNPSAAYSPEGSGGVINLISNPNRPRAGNTVTGSIRANVGDNGRWNLGGNVVRVAGPVTLSADVGIRSDFFRQEMRREREIYNSGAGRFLPALQTRDAEGTSDVGYARLSAEYRLNDKTSFTLEGRYTDVDVSADGLDTYAAENALGGIAQGYRRHGVGGFQGEFWGVTGRVLHRFDDQGHEWSNEVRFDQANHAMGSVSYADNLIPVASPYYETIDSGNDQGQLGFTSAYVRPLGDGGKLRLGYELQDTHLEVDNLVMRGLTQATHITDPAVSNLFKVDQVVHAVYATWEKPFGEKLSAQFGLRLEQANLDLDQVTTNIQSSNDYFRAYPTLHLSYLLDDTQTLRASYSRRIQRPGPNDLNPFLTYQDSLNLRSGNPNLLPQETDSFELMWQKRVQQTFYQATLYYRDTSDAFTQVTTDLGGGVVLTRPENLGSSTATGLELVANGALTSTLRYNASLNAFRQEIESPTLLGGVSRSGETISGRLALNWQPTPSDFVQLSTMTTGDQQLAQGTRESATLVNFGYRRKLNDDWSVQATVRDVFDNFGAAIVTETSTFRDRTEQSFGGRSMYIGLTWNFGQGRRRPEQFDFSGPQTGN